MANIVVNFVNNRGKYDGFELTVTSRKAGDQYLEAVNEILLRKEQLDIYQITEMFVELGGDVEQ